MSAGDTGSCFAEAGVELFRPGAYFGVEADGFERLPELLFVGLGGGGAQGVSDGSGEEVGVLGDDGDAARVGDSAGVGGE